MKNKKDENTETTENVKKKKKAPIIAVVILLVIIGSCNANRNKDNSVSDSSISSESSLTETTDKATVETSATTKTTEKSTMEQSTEEETTADSDISPESFVSTIEEAIQGAVGSDEYITDVALTDDTLTISVDLSKADTTIVPLEDLAVSRASSITDDFLELEEYDNLWNKIVIDFGDIGSVSRTSNDIIENEYGMRCFEIYELDSNFSAHESSTEEITTEYSTDIVKATINLSLSQQDVFDYEVSYNEEIDTYIANMWYDGLTLGITTNPTQYVEFQQTAANTCKTLYDSIQDIDPGAHFSIFILNDINKENVLITILDGVVVYSIISE